MRKRRLVLHDLASIFIPSSSTQILSQHIEPMHLINIREMRLEFFQGIDMPDYAILSHTWGNNELLYKDMADIDKAKRGAGLAKVMAACKQARNDGLNYIWVDTCCINKESSSELSEAINSMYAWYQKSYICYAYLADVPDNDDPTASPSAFEKSRWFTRGWTLQELIAPLSVIFYGTKWGELGTKASLQPVISAITGIEARVILVNHAGEVSVAKRMSWAAHRMTTREEDIAYCLMGLFGVNMPLLYGEGRNAFIRLQHEIIKLSDDQSIFAWLTDGDEDRGLLAHHPLEFAGSRDIVKDDNGREAQYSITNKGIQIELSLLPEPGEPGVFCAPLNCSINGGHSVSIFLKREKGDLYTRTHTSRFREVAQGARQRSSLFVKERDPSRFDVSTWMRPQPGYLCSVQATIPVGFAKPQLYPPKFWVEGEGTKWTLTMNKSGNSGVLVFANPTKRVKIVVIIGIHNFSVWSDVLILPGENTETPPAICDSYYNSDHPRHHVLWKNRDRSSTSLLGMTVSVSIKKILIGQERQLAADITVRSDGAVGRGSYPTQWRPPPGMQYIFWLTIMLADNRYTVSEALPRKGSDDRAYWETHNGSRILCLGNSGISGILLFENSTERFAVMIGIHNYKVWTDIVTNVKQETASDIWGSYYREGGRGNQLWAQRRESGAHLANGSVSLVIKNSSSGNNYFLADIVVSKK